MNVYLNTYRQNERNYDIVNSTSTFTNWQSLVQMLKENGVIDEKTTVKALVIEDDGISFALE